jgi:hypothetical protein
LLALVLILTIGLREIFKSPFSRLTFRLISLSSTKSNTGFLFVALLAFAEDSFALERFPGEKPGLIGKFSTRECISTGWNNEPGEALYRLCGEATPAVEAPRGDS